MRTGVRYLIVAAVVVATVGGVVAWSGVLAPRGDPPVRTTQVLPAPEQWPGIRWTRVDEPALEARDVWLNDVASHGPLIVGWGGSAIRDPAGENGFRQVSTLWTSQGGLGWQRNELKLLSGEAFWPQALAVGPVGYLAFGFKGGNAGKGDGIAVAAGSADGQRWVEAGRPPLEMGSLLAATETGFVTAGIAAGRPAVLFTADGVTWVAMSVPAGLGEYQLSDIRRTPAGVVVSGTVLHGPDWDGVIWQGGASAFDDLAGASPTFVGLDRGVSVSRTVPFAAGILALGVAGEFPDCALAGRVASLGPIIADTCGGPPPTAWVTNDGHRWQEVPGPRPPGRVPDGQPVIVSIAAGGAGLVALVEEVPMGPEGSVPGTWTSRDGVEWWRLGDGVPLGSGSGVGPLVGLPGRIVAVVRTDSGINVWLGTPDG